MKHTKIKNIQPSDIGKTTHRLRLDPYRPRTKKLFLHRAQRRLHLSNLQIIVEETTPQLQPS